MNSKQFEYGGEVWEVKARTGRMEHLAPLMVMAIMQEHGVAQTSTMVTDNVIL